MKRTEIKYHVTFDEKINVTEISNVLAYDELYAILGAERLREYAEKGGWMASNYRKNAVDFVKDNYPILEVKLYTRVEFRKAITHLKTRGQLFTLLKNQVEDMRTILI